MTLGSLNIGDVVYDPLTYSSSSAQGGANGQRRAYYCLKWTIVDKNRDGSNTVTLLNLNGSSEAHFDYQEASNPDSGRKTDGNSRYKFSNILQWLNSDAASNWYTAQHTYDAVNNYDKDKPGFLYRFSSGLKNALISVSRKVAIPAIDGGGSEDISKKVHLPALSEVFGTVSNYISEGNQLTYYANKLNAGEFVSKGYFRTAWYDTANKNVSGSKIIDYASKSGARDVSMTNRVAQSYYPPEVLITLPSTTTVSSVAYRKDVDSSDRCYAMVNMPLIVELSGNNVNTTNPTTNIVYTVYDENYSISSLKIGLDSKDNTVYSTVNLTKGHEYSYAVNGSSWAIGESHTYYFTVTNSNGTEVTETKKITREDIRPEIQLYDSDSKTWVSYKNLYETSKPPTVKLKIYDADNQGQDMWVYFSDNSSIYSSYPPIELIGHYTTNQEIEYTIPVSTWESLDNKYYELYFHIGTAEYVDTGYSYQSNRCRVGLTKQTPAPTVEVDSVNIGEQNAGFSITYTPTIQTLHTITNVSVYVDDELISSDDSPVADQEYTYTMTKQALYDLDLGAHKIKFTATDDLSQTGTTEVAFTRVNNAPTLITESALGDKRDGFSISFTGSDEDGDTFNVSAYMDSVSGTPFATVSDMSLGDTESVNVTKAALYDLSLAEHTIYLVATDTEEQTTITQVTFTRVNDAPVIGANSSIGEINGDFDVSFSASDTENDSFGISAYIDDHAYQIATIADATPNNTYTYTVPKSAVYGLDLGAHTIHITATDSVGRSSTQDVTFTRVNNSPSIQTAFDGGIMYDDFNITFTVTDAESDPVDISVKVDNRTIATESGVTLGTPITETIEVGDLSVGNHSIQILANDSEEQSSTFTGSFVKDERPIITALDYGNTTEGFTTHYQVYDNGAQVTVEIKLDGVLIDTQTVLSSDYQTDLDITVADVSRLTYDTHTINIKATDTNGEYSTRDITFARKSVPNVSVSIPTLGDITQPFDITVNYDSADGEEVTIKAYIDGVEI